MINGHLIVKERMIVPLRELCRYEASEEVRVRRITEEEWHRYWPNEPFPSEFKKPEPSTRRSTQPTITKGGKTNAGKSKSK